jgi:hypothetical protein
MISGLIKIESVGVSLSVTFPFSVVLINISLISHSSTKSLVAFNSTNNSFNLSYSY